MVVSVRGSETFDYDVPEELFELPAEFLTFAVADGGDHLIISRRVSGDGPPPSIAIVDNWLAEFEPH